MSYYLESLKPRSEKITLVTAEAVERLKLFDASGANWSRVVNHFVVGVKDGGTALTSWTFDAKTMTLTILGGVNPKLRNISVTYRFFFSNAPFILPYDLNNGEEVEWQPYISSVGAIGQQLDEDNTGVVLETASSFKLINTDGFFDSVFDVLIWENQVVRFYSFIPTAPVSESVLLFDGLIENKAFSESSVTFSVRDFISKLKNRLEMGEHIQDPSNKITPSMIGKPLRRIYGQFNNLRCVCISAVNEGFSLTIDGISSVSVVEATTVMTGSSATWMNFLSSVSPDDEIVIYKDGIRHVFGVEDVVDSLTITLSRPSDITLLNVQAVCSPKTPWQEKSRSWLVAGHKISEPYTTIQIVRSPQNFKVFNAENFFVGDRILVNGEETLVKSVFDDTIITSTIVGTSPTAGSPIQKIAISRAFASDREFVYKRDYDYLNSTTARIVFKTTAEFNVAVQRSVGASLTFTNGSRVLTTTAVVDLRTILKTRDWVASTNPSNPDFYEILKVEEQTITLRKPVVISGGPKTENAFYKSIDMIDEDSDVTVNCTGMEVGGKWIKRPADAVRHLIEADSGLTNINETSFDQARFDCDYILSLAIPDDVGSKPPAVRDVVTQINNSCFGSLYVNSESKISYSILNSDKPDFGELIQDDDIFSFSASTKQGIVNEVEVSYSPYVDIYSNSNAFKINKFESEFVNELIGIKNTKERVAYIYEDDKAEIIAQRLALFNSLSNTTLKIKASINLSTKAVNDKVYLMLDRLFDRFGQSGKRKAGIVSGISKTEFGATLTIIDMGNILNRVPSIASNIAQDHGSANEEEMLKWGYIVDDSTLTPDATSEDGLGNNIIG